MTSSSTAPPAKAPCKKAKLKHGAASPLLTNPNGTSPEPGRASEDAAPTGPRTSLVDGVVKPVGARIDWASLLKRVYLEDVLACPCGGRRRTIADITERDVGVAHLDLETEAPPLARTRSPGFDDT